MNKSIRRTLLRALSVSLLGPVLAGCATTPGETKPVEIEWAKYNGSEDAAFLPKDIFSSGTVRKRRDILELRYLAKKSRFLLRMEWGLMNMIMKED